MSKSIIQGVTPEEKEFSDNNITWHKGVLLGIEKNTSWKYVTNLGINFKYCREQSNTAEDFIEQARINHAIDVQKKVQKTKPSNNSNASNDINSNKISSIHKIKKSATPQQQFTSCSHCSHHISQTLNKCMMCIHFSLVDNFTPRKTSYSA
ncbi:hypothetical protein [sulfur-oxidizing endosymbiont of Gigantopelta aegis]|uniref:hypothetical protein n=1 Tax=sulfur-oxidizing endosymbiont of Gigantopelta aegis TaxID=2794934 RepID=UPI0018DD28D7|nr:hypothetical protein [sulfur-oxidizing endosymbiont of Gigantopelta aegis]